MAEAFIIRIAKLGTKASKLCYRGERISEERSMDVLKSILFGAALLAPVIAGAQDIAPIALNSLSATPQGIWLRVSAYLPPLAKSPEKPQNPQSALQHPLCPAGVNSVLPPFRATNASPHSSAKNYIKGYNAESRIAQTFGLPARLGAAQPEIGGLFLAKLSALAGASYRVDHEANDYCAAG